MNRTMRVFAAAIATFMFATGAHAASFLQGLDIGRAAKGIGGVVTGGGEVSEKEEIALGRELAGRTLGAAPLVNDANLQRYVNRVGQAIAAQTDRPDLPWRFGVIDTPTINAFAAPGGAILVTRGLYELLDNEAQLAGVLGHEVAHVVKRHHVTVFQSQKRTAAVGDLGQQALGQSRIGRQDVFGVGNMIIGTGAEWLTFKLDRNAEFEADQIGTMLAAKAGYSVSGMIDVLQKLRARAGEPETGMIFETHPHPSDRLTALGNAIEPQLAKLPPGQEPPPPLAVAASGLPEPVAGSAAVPAPGRGLTAEQQRQQAAPPAVGDSPNIPGVRGSGSGSGGGIGPALEGLFRRR